MVLGILPKVEGGFRDLAKKGRWFLRFGKKGRMVLKICPKGAGGFRDLAKKGEWF